MKPKSISARVVLQGDAPAVEARNIFPRMSVVIWNASLSTPEASGQSVGVHLHGTFGAPLRMLEAISPGVLPPSVSSILNVILGFILFSSLSPGESIVAGNAIWTSIP